MSLLKLLGLGADSPASGRSVGDTDTVRKIVAELDHLPDEEAAYIAAFAYILSRVARADMSISDEETRAMERTVVEHGSMPEEQAIIVVQMAKTQNLLFGGTENYLVSQEFNRIATREQKMALLDCLFAISAADLSITSAEDKVIRQIADEVMLEHSDFIEVRARFREHLAVLKKPESGSGDGAS
jgi:uncharacterized tellurite resistance protein B-like protein